MSLRPAYVLPQSAVAGTAAVNLSGFPGMWTPGDPIAAAELVRHGGFASEAELHARVAELGLPLELVEGAASEGVMPVPANHVQAADAAEESTRQRGRRTSEPVPASAPASPVSPEEPS